MRNLPSMLGGPLLHWFPLYLEAVQFLNNKVSVGMGVVQAFSDSMPEDKVVIQASSNLAWGGKGMVQGFSHSM